MAARKARRGRSTAEARRRSRAAKKGWETRRKKEREEARKRAGRSRAAKKGWETRRAKVASIAKKAETEAAAARAREEWLREVDEALARWRREKEEARRERQERQERQERLEKEAAEAAAPAVIAQPLAAHAPWPGLVQESVESLLRRFSQITYRGRKVSDIEASVDEGGVIRLRAVGRVGRSRVRIQGYEVVKRFPSHSVTSMFWGQLDNTSAEDPRSAFEEGLYPGTTAANPDVDFITAWRVLE